MKKVGFDFGTTNSIISYFDEQKQTIMPFKSAASSPEYIPSSVAYREKNGSIEVIVGQKAKSHLTNKSFQVYERFKLFLCESEERLKQYGYNSTPPEKVTEDYFRVLFDTYEKVQGIEVVELVVTVPEIWLKEEKHRTAREKIKEICQKVGLPLKKIISEPQAACAYFCYAHKENERNDFRGHVLVVDFGGGTLDISLCEVSPGPKIKVLESSGRGEDNIYIGCAGVAFDQEMVSHIYQKAHGVDVIIKDDKSYIKALEEFEHEKIVFTDDISSKLEQYYMDETLVEDEEVFVVECNGEEVPIYCEDLVKTYNKINREILIESLKDMNKFFQHHGVDDKDLEHFKILMVGGFSNFYCVQKTVRDYFQSTIGEEDDRFKNCLTTVDKTLAISYGAAVIANNLVEITYTCPYTLGIRVYIQTGIENNYAFQERDIDIIQKGEKIDGILGPVFSNIKLGLNIQKLSVTSRSMIIYIHDGVNKRYIALDQNIENLFPNTDILGNRWIVGFSVDEDIILSLWVKDFKDEKVTSLQRLIESLPPIIVCE